MPLSTQEYKWAPANMLRRLPAIELASQPGGLAILLVASCLGNWNKLQQLRATRIERLYVKKRISHLPKVIFAFAAF